MILTGLELPERREKPREEGITIIIDNGIPLNFFKDVIHSSADFIDFVKFGWGTSLVTKRIEEKIEWLQEHNVHYFFGGTLFEKFLSQKKVENFYRFCKHFNCPFVEISNGTVDFSNTEKAKFISDFSCEFHVISEVGYKDSQKADFQNSSEWIENIFEDLEAGSWKVITEARESGTSGVCKRNGEIRYELMEDILSSGLPVNDLIFEAPNKKMQTFFIKRLGQNVNLGNISFNDIISLETLRLGLRSDTLCLFEQEKDLQRSKKSLSARSSM